MVAERDFPAARILRHVVQDTAAHPRAEAARIFLFSVLKDDFTQIRAADAVFHVPRTAERLHGAVIGFPPVEAGIGCQRDHFVALRVVPAHHGERIQQIKGILSAGDADRDAVSLFNHLVFFRRRADVAHQSVHTESPGYKV